MPRRVKVQTKEMGLIELYLIYERNGVWEDDWRPLQAEGVFASQISSITKESMEHAYIGWTRPLVTVLGPAPNGMLRALQPITRECALRDSCTFYRAKECGSLAPSMPWCFEPAGVSSESRALAAEGIRVWREGVYILVVQEPSDE